MTTLENKSYFFSFSQPKSFMLFFRHIDKAFYLFITVAILFSYKDLKGQLLSDVFLITCVLFLITFFLGKFLLKVIWRFDIDFNKKEMVFYLCRKDIPVRVHFSKIKRIVVSGAIYFHFEKRSLLYSTNQYNEILPILKTFKDINWGRMCDSLGPDKFIRDMIDGK